MPKAPPAMHPPHNRIRTEISADLFAFLRSLPASSDLGELTLWRHSGSLFGFKSSLAPDHHFIVKVRAHANKPGYDPESWARPEEDSNDPTPQPLSHSD